MGFNVFMSRSEIVERYLIPPELETEVFSVLKPSFGSGEAARYLESLVDHQLDKYFKNKERLRNGNERFYPKEDMGMAKSWADTVADEGAERSCLSALEPLLVDEEQAAQMLGVSRRMIFDLNKQGTLPCKMVGARKLYSVKRLREFAEGLGA